MSADAIRSYEILEGSRLSNAQKSEARLFALQIVRDPEFRARLLAQARGGRLAPPVLTMLFHYAYGKPADRVEVTKGPNLEDLTEEQLIARLDAVKGAITGTNKELEPAGAAEQVAATEVALDQVLAFKKNPRTF